MLPDNVTATVAVGDCGVAEATWPKLIGTDPVIGEPIRQTPALPVHRHRHRHRARTAAGVVAVIVVLLTTTTLVAAVAPNFTVAPAAKFVPVIVTAVPPAAGPLFGTTLLTVGDNYIGESIGQTSALPARLSPSPSPHRRFPPESWP